MIYTCYEMIRDCAAGKPEGWRYFISNYVPVIRKLTAHYDPSADTGRVVGRILNATCRPAAPLFDSLDPSPERWFVARLRQTMMSEMEPAAPPEMPLSLETVGDALAPLSITQKLAVWMETMRYDAAQTGAMLRMAPATVEKTRDHGADLLRRKVENWRRTILAENGFPLQKTAGQMGSKDCLPPRVFLDVLDGRATWQGREEMERHAGDCWHCVDNFARMAEVIELLRGIRPIDDAETAAWLESIGVHDVRSGFWRRR